MSLFLPFISTPAREEYGAGEGGISGYRKVFSILGDLCISCLYLVCHFYIPTESNEGIQEISVFSKMPHLLSH